MKAGSILRQLAKDHIFWLACAAGPFFWLSLYISGIAITGPAWLADNVTLFLQLALLYPILEELVFRGLIQESLWKTRLGRLSIYCVSMPNIITSIIFTGFHFLTHSPAWALSVIVPSLVFGFFRDRYQHIAAPIILHVLYNFGYFLLFGK